MNLSDSQKIIISNIGWSLCGKIVNLTSALFVGILVARYLGPENYGVMNYVISYVAIFSVFATFGLDDIEIRELSRHNDKKNVILGTCFSLRIIFASISYFGIAISLLLSKVDHFTSLMILAYGLTLFTSVGNILRNYFTSIVKNKYIVKSEIFRTFIGAGIKIFLLLIKAPFEYFIYAQILDTLLVASGYYVSYNSAIGSIRLWKFDKAIAGFILKESFPLVLSGAAVMIYQRIDQVMIGNMLDKTAVGYFATAGKFVDLIVFLPYVLVQTITPMLIRAKELSPKTYKAKERIFLSLITWTSIIMSLIVSILAYWLITYTYGEKYSPAIPVLQIMSFKAVGMALSSSGGQIIIMDHIQKWAFIRNIIGCVVCITLNYLVIPKFGIIGSAAVTIVTALFTGCFANVFIPSYHKIMMLQIYALFCGWRELGYIKRMFIK